MKVLKVRNVNEALVQGLKLLQNEGLREESRAGPVLVLPYPVTTMYERPMERVLFSPARDANPFFHLFEALWMLAGRDDAIWLDQFVGDFSARFAEKDGKLHGAYGYRWRKAFGFDQLVCIAETLKRDPTSRQCVLQMWDGYESYPPYHHDFGNDDLRGSWKDRPCNTHVYFRVRDCAPDEPAITDFANPRTVLDMTVCCRSNDIIWGAYGANAVHFSVLQEYMAARIGVGVGLYYQVSNNYHVYLDMFQKMGTSILHELPGVSSYPAKVTPIVTDLDKFDLDLQLFFSGTPGESGVYANSFFPQVARPMYVANQHRKARGDYKHLVESELAQMADGDWKQAARAWWQRRMNKRGLGGTDVSE